MHLSTRPRLFWAKVLRSCQVTAAFGKEGLRIGSQVVDRCLSIRLAGRVGLLACLDAPLPSHVYPRDNRDNMLDCRVCFGFLHQPFGTHTSFLDVE